MSMREVRDKCRSPGGFAVVAKTGESLDARRRGRTRFEPASTVTQTAFRFFHNADKCKLLREQRQRMINPQA